MFPQQLLTRNQCTGDCEEDYENLLIAKTYNLYQKEVSTHEELIEFMKTLQTAVLQPHQSDRDSEQFLLMTKNNVRKALKTQR